MQTHAIPILAGAALIGILALVLAIFPTNQPAASIELNFASVSPAGGAGGAVIPASCGSPHAGDECTPPDFTANGDEGGTQINEGDDVLLEWECVGSDSSSGVNFSTGGAPQGSTTVTPDNDTTYTVVCSNGGQKSVDVDVLHPDMTISADPDRVRSGNTSEISWSATQVNAGTCSVSEDNPNINDAWTGDSGTETTSALEFETVYTLTCQTDAGPTSESVTVGIAPVFEEF